MPCSMRWFPYVQGDGFTNGFKMKFLRTRFLRAQPLDTFFPKCTARQTKSRAISGALLTKTSWLKLSSIDKFIRASTKIVIQIQL